MGPTHGSPAGDLLAQVDQRPERCPRNVAQEALTVVSDMTRATMLEAIRAQSNALKQWFYIAEGKTASMFRWWTSRSCNVQRTRSNGCVWAPGPPDTFKMADSSTFSPAHLARLNLRTSGINPSYPISGRRKISGFRSDRGCVAIRHTHRRGIKQLGRAVFRQELQSKHLKPLKKSTMAFINWSLHPAAWLQRHCGMG